MRFFEEKKTQFNTYSFMGFVVIDVLNEKQISVFFFIFVVIVVICLSVV